MKPQNRQETGKKATRTSFKPGKSGNPGGRPKRTPEEKAEELAFEAACRAKTNEALGMIQQLMHKADKDSVRLSAAIFILERGWGKAVQMNEHTGKNREPIEHRIVAEIVTGAAPRYR